MPLTRHWAVTVFVNCWPVALWVTVTVAVLSWGELTETLTGGAVQAEAVPTQSPDHWMA